ncbi:MAG: aspartate kinase [Bacteroidales bacterium]|jgi:aspartate kinase|nr:aspartate kinase [Bacteroidales bacterium]
MKILKFGGTSVGSPERMKALRTLIVNDEPKIVVLSAMSGTTNSLVEIASFFALKEYEKAAAAIKNLEEKYAFVVKELYETAEYNAKATAVLKERFDEIKTAASLATVEANVRERIILAQGELISTMLQNFYLNETGVKSVLLPALNFMRKDLNDEPDMFFISEILKREIAQYPDCRLFITQGYICRNYAGEIDNLKRGGSDYSASIIGAATGAEEVQIWTDIDGFHNNDPRVVEKTHSISHLSFDEAAELAYFGAKILHPACVIPVQEAGIPLRIKNTMDPNAFGTLISDETKSEDIKAVAAKDNITAIKIKSGRMLLAYGFLRKIFEVFEKYKTSIDMITTSEVAVSLTVDDITHLDAITGEIKKFGTVEIDKNMSIISIVGNKISESKGATAKIFGALNDIPVRMISFGGSRYNISLLVEECHKKSAMEALNQKLF